MCVHRPGSKPGALYNFHDERKRLYGLHPNVYLLSVPVSKQMLSARLATLSVLNLDKPPRTHIT